MPDAARSISAPLMLGLVALPAIFFWFLLRPGYASSTRRIVAAYALIPPALAATSMLMETAIR